uniref:Secreted protein n=1 Tax=Syphacia muris TaxID=451379 RepID=A0A0N5AS28_9BILA
MRVFLLVIVAFVSAVFCQYPYGSQAKAYPQYPINIIPNRVQGIYCTKNAHFVTTIDGTAVNVQCNGGGANAVSRCTGCCKAYALIKGRTTDNSAGFLGNDGKCVCCSLY